jgi:hypothetical protein
VKRFALYGTCVLIGVVAVLVGNSRHLNGQPIWLTLVIVLAAEAALLVVWYGVRKRIG